FGMAVTNAWSDHEEAALALGLTPSSYPLFKKVGFRDVGPVPFYQKVVDTRAVARRRLGGLLGTLATPAVALGLRLQRRLRRALGERAGLVRHVRAPGPDLPDLEVPGLSAPAIRCAGSAAGRT